MVETFNFTLRPASPYCVISTEQNKRTPGNNAIACRLKMMSWSDGVSCLKIVAAISAASERKN